MKTKQGGRVLLALFGLAALCITVAIHHHLMGELMPVWAACCHILDVATANGMLPWPRTAVRILITVILLAGLLMPLPRIWRTHRFSARLRGLPVKRPSGDLADLCGSLALSIHVIVLETPIPLAFCYGLLKPHIYLSTGLLDMLTCGELKSVLLHEDHHRRHYDPLRTLFANLLATVLFFLPAVADWRDLFLTSLELAADRHAAHESDRFSLAGALYKMLVHPQSRQLSAIVAISDLSATNARIASLLDDTPPAIRHSPRSLLLSIAALLLSCTAIQLALF